MNQPIILKTKAEIELRKYYVGRLEMLRQTAMPALKGTMPKDFNENTAPNLMMNLDRATVALGPRLMLALIAQSLDEYAANDPQISEKGKALTSMWSTVLATLANTSDLVDDVHDQIMNALVRQAVGAEDEPEKPKNES